MVHRAFIRGYSKTICVDSAKMYTIRIINGYAIKIIKRYPIKIIITLRPFYRSPARFLCHKVISMYMYPTTWILTLI